MKRLIFFIVFMFIAGSFIGEIRNSYGSASDTSVDDNSKSKLEELSLITKLKNAESYFNNTKIEYFAKTYSIISWDDPNENRKLVVETKGILFVDDSRKRLDISYKQSGFLYRESHLLNCDEYRFWSRKDDSGGRLFIRKADESAKSVFLPKIFCPFTYFGGATSAFRYIPLDNKTFAIRLVSSGMFVELLYRDFEEHVRLKKVQIRTSVPASEKDNVCKTSKTCKKTKMSDSIEYFYQHTDNKEPYKIVWHSFSHNISIEYIMNTMKFQPNFEESNFLLTGTKNTSIIYLPE